MSRKAKFKPEITRVKLNPEQAVLECPCWTASYIYDAGGRNKSDVCNVGGYTRPDTTSAASSHGDPSS